MAAEAVPVLDAAAAYPELYALRAALAAQDWLGVRAITDAPRGLGPRTTLIAMLDQVPESEAFLYEVLRWYPDDSAAAALLGAHLIATAWAARSSYQAAYVSSSQFATFHALLNRAEQMLIDAAARTPGDPAVWSQRLLTARGLELGLSEVQRRYDKVAAIDPHHTYAQGQFLQSLAPKWGGTWEQMHAFATERMNAAPPGSFSPVLVVTGHLERWLAATETGGPQAGEQYLRDTPAGAEIYTAANRSIWDPGFTHDVGWVSVRSTFAMAFSLLGDDRAAAGQFQAMGPLGTASPWGYFGQGTAEFTKRRARALAAVGVA